MQVFNFKDDFNTVMEQAKALQEQSANQGQFTQPVQPQGQFAQPAQGQFTQPVQPTQGQFTQPVQPQGQFAQPTQGQVTQPTQSEQPANTTQSFQVDVFGSNDVPQTHQQGFPTSVVPEPIQEPVKEPVQEPVKEQVQEPVKEQVPEPVEEPTVKEVKETKTKTKKARKTAKKATKEEIQADAPIDTKEVVNHILDDATVKEIKDQLYSAVYDLSVDVIKKAMVDAAVAAAKDLRG